MKNFEARIIKLEQYRKPAAQLGPSLYDMSDNEVASLLASGAIEQMNAFQCEALLGGPPTPEEIADALAGEDGVPG